MSTCLVGAADAARVIVVGDVGVDGKAIAIWLQV